MVNRQPAHQQYLKKYGYLNDGPSELAKISDQDTLSQAIAKFQHFAGLNETGSHKFWTDLI